MIESLISNAKKFISKIRQKSRIGSIAFDSDLGQIDTIFLSSMGVSFF